MPSPELSTSEPPLFPPISRQQREYCRRAGPCRCLGPCLGAGIWARPRPHSGHGRVQILVTVESRFWIRPRPDSGQCRAQILDTPVAEFWIATWPQKRKRRRARYRSPAQPAKDLTCRHNLSLNLRYEAMKSRGGPRARIRGRHPGPATFPKRVRRRSPNGLGDIPQTGQATIQNPDVATTRNRARP